MNGTTDPLTKLKTDMDEAVAYAQGRSKVWAGVYYATRSALIIFSALTSAQLIGALAWAASWQPAFALVVTMLAAFDAWLKPGDKYRAAYIAVDDFNQIRQEIEFIDTADKASVQAKLNEYKQLTTKLSAAVFP